MEAFERAVRAISAGALQIAAAACLICFALMCYSVAMRYFFGAPQSWIDYALGWLVVAMVMFAAPAAQLTGEHVAVDTISDRARAPLVDPDPRAGRLRADARRRADAAAARSARPRGG
jgi:TRAP-type C4-dicarboxylate transport system permease small subunit